MKTQLKTKNIFADIPKDLENEIFETICSSSSFRIERILSKGHQTPEGFWYDQDQPEWVLVLKGGATLEFADGGRYNLGVGDYMNIPAHTKHRVSRTSEEEVTIWLAVFYESDPLKK